MWNVNEENGDGYVEWPKSGLPTPLVWDKNG